MATSSLPAVDRLRQIAEEIRKVPEACKDLMPAELAGYAGSLFYEAITLGVFQGPKYVKLHVLIKRQLNRGDQKSGSVLDREMGIWVEACNCLVPLKDIHYYKDWGKLWDACCEPIADLIDAETTSLKAEKLKKGEGDGENITVEEGNIAALKTRVKVKKSTAKGDAQPKIIAVLTKHHKYADDSCLNLEPIGNNELARQAGVSESTTSAFFKKEFKGHLKYKRTCSDATQLVTALKLLNQEFSPYHLFGGNPPGEADRDEE